MGRWFDFGAHLSLFNCDTGSSISHLVVVPVHHLARCLKSQNLSFDKIDAIESDTISLPTILKPNLRYIYPTICSKDGPSTLCFLSSMLFTVLLLCIICFIIVLKERCATHKGWGRPIHLLIDSRQRRYYVLTIARSQFIGFAQWMPK